MSKHKIKFIITFFAVPFLLSGCTISFGGTTQNSTNNGGIWVSSNQGNTWSQKALIPTTSGSPRSIAGIDANDLVMDPSDNKTLYLASQDNGLFYTYDAGDSWQIAVSLGKINIKSVAVDPLDKCNIYVTSDNKAYKSADCSRTWQQIYFDNDPTVVVNTVAVDNYNDNNIFLGLSRGEILKSVDRGTSWQTVGRLGDNVQKIVISANDTRMMFAGTRLKGIFRSKDNGYNWSSLANNLRAFADAVNFKDLAVSPSKPGFLILANTYGLIESSDNGDTWSAIQLITPEKEATINAVTLNPKNPDEIYYVTNTTFYRSLDGGKDWTTKKLPTARSGYRVIVDRVDTGLVYLGVKIIKR